MPVSFPYGFILATPEPIDSRIVINDRTTLLQALAYEGLVVYDSNDKKLYKLTDVANVNNTTGWKEIPDRDSSLSLTQTISGPSSSLILSSSGTATGSLTDGLVWIVTSPASQSGETYIWSSGSKQWFFIPKLDTAAGDERYLVKATGGTVSGSITLSSGYKLIGTASWAESASFATNALGLAGGEQFYIPYWKDNGTNLTASIIRQSNDNNIGIGISSPAYKLDVSGSAKITNDTGSGAILYLGDTKNTFTARAYGLSGDRFTAIGTNILEAGNRYDSTKPGGGIYFDDRDNVPPVRLMYTDAGGSGTGLTGLSLSKAGNIGIGTLSPAYKLDVSGDIATSTNLSVSSSIIYYGPFGSTDPGNNPLKIIQKSNWSADPGVIIGALNTIHTASNGVIIGGTNESYARGGANWIIGSSNYLTSSIYVGNNNYIFGYGNKVSGSAIDTRPIGGGTGNQILIGNSNVSDMSTNGQVASILIGAFNNTNGYRGGGMYGSRLRYYADNQLVFGHNSQNVDFAIRDVFFGMGVRNEYGPYPASNNGLEGNGVNVSINPSWAADAADRNAGSLNLNGGRGTGTGSAGDVIFATATTGSTGATLHSLTNRVWVKGHTGNVGIGISTPSGSLHVSGTVYFSNITTSSVALTNVLMISSSGQIFTTASSAIGGGGTTSATLKAGSASISSFGTSPLTSSVTFGSAFSNNNYAVTVTGEDARVWTIQNKVSGGFQINSNSDIALTGPVYWIATPFNS